MLQGQAEVTERVGEVSAKRLSDVLRRNTASDTQDEWR